MRSRKLVRRYGSLFFIALCLSYFYKLTSHAPNPTPSATNTADAIDARLTQLHIRTFNEQGQLISELHTPQVTHHPSQSQYQLDTPHIHTNGPEQPILDIRAMTAWAEPQQQSIRFQRQVTLTSTPKNAQERTTLHTEALTYHARTQEAETDQPVILSQQGLHIQSKGLHATAHHLHLSQQTKGIYQPLPQHASQREHAHVSPLP